MAAATWVQRIIRKARGRRVGAPAPDGAGAGDSVPSRIHVDVQEDLLYWSRVLRVSPAELVVAVDRVGDDVSAVARYLFGGDEVGPTRPPRRRRAREGGGHEG